MSEKVKECFKPHIIMHSLFGLGLGIVLANQFVVFNRLWLGLVLIVVAVVWDMTRK